jgi:hypothetical protein
MKRRDFLEISAAASAAVMLGSLVNIEKSCAVNSDAGHGQRLDGYPRMRGGCRDFRAMNDFVPGFFEREIIDNWA